MKTALSSVFLAVAATAAAQGGNQLPHPYQTAPSGLVWEMENFSAWALGAPGGTDEIWYRSWLIEKRYETVTFQFPFGEMSYTIVVGAEVGHNAEPLEFVTSTSGGYGKTPVENFLVTGAAATSINSTNPVQFQHYIGLSPTGDWMWSEPRIGGLNPIDP